jgi:Ca2+/H+ antiporter, TMEM165/GDT1 family
VKSGVLTDRVQELRGDYGEYGTIANVRLRSARRLLDGLRGRTGGRQVDLHGCIPLIGFHALIVFMAITAAFAAKSLAAVLLAQTLIRLHSHWTDLLSAVAFFFSALFIWCKEPKPLPTDHPAETRWWQPAAISFASLFFTEWGDPGQIAVAALTMKFHSPAASWLGGALAMATKGGLAITLGLKLRERLPLGVLRTVASASCGLLGILALARLSFVEGASGQAITLRRKSSPGP